jgi:hypothetical protein
MSEPLRRIAFALLLLAGAASLVWFGFLGGGRSNAFSMDYTVMYAGGRVWLQGGNPYDQAQLGPVLRQLNELRGEQSTDEEEPDAPFSYPPQSAALFVPLALLPFAAAQVGWFLVNLLSLAVVLAFTVPWLLRRAPPGGDLLGLGLVIAFILGSPLTTNVFWLGQTSLVVFAATLAGWHLNRQGRKVLAGVCLGLATMKPQICLLVFVWLVLDRDWKPILAAAVTAAVLAIYPMTIQGPVGAVQAWLARLGTHNKFDANMPGFEHVIGLGSLLQAAGLAPPGADLIKAGTILAALLTVMLWFYRDRLDGDDLFGLLMGLMVTFIFVHDCEYICLIPLFTSLWLYLRERGPAVYVWVALMLLFVFPRRQVRKLDIPVLSHWRTVLTLILIGLVIGFSLRRRRAVVRAKPPEGLAWAGSPDRLQ